jgi:hypothetical protein
VQLVEWSELSGLRLLANTYWVVFELPKDAASCGRGLLVIPRMSLGRHTGEQFAVYTEMPRNMTLSRRLPGVCVLKAIIQAHRRLGFPAALPSRHVFMERYHMDRRHGAMLFARLTEGFVALLWVFSLVPCMQGQEKQGRKSGHRPVKMWATAASSSWMYDLAS